MDYSNLIFALAYALQAVAHLIKFKHADHDRRSCGDPTITISTILGSKSDNGLGQHSTRRLTTPNDYCLSIVLSLAEERVEAQPGFEPGWDGLARPLASPLLCLDVGDAGHRGWPADNTSCSVDDA